MYISRIALDLFRSWKHIIFDCKPGINVIYGNNGLGKTNIVESLEVVGTGISHRTSLTLPLINRGNKTATIRLNVYNNQKNQNNQNKNNNEQSTDEQIAENQTTYEVTLNLKGTNRARINDGKSLYMRDIIGSLPVVSFTPRDQSLIIGDPTIRRTFIDQAGALLLPNYVQTLQEFKHIAKQRAALLKNIRESTFNNQSNSLSGLEIWTGKFIEIGINLTKLRQQTISILNKYFIQIFNSLTENKDCAELKYLPSFEEVFINKNAENSSEILALLSEHFQRIYLGELSRGCNLIGPHRDDIIFMLNNMPAKDFASNGESWTLAVAAKMALCKALEEKNNSKPIIILDDVFAQLDENRRKQILNFSKDQGQVFITTSSLNDIPEDDEIKENNLINIEKIAENQNTINNIYTDHDELLRAVIEQRNYESNYEQESAL